VPLHPLMAPRWLIRGTPRGVWAALWPAWSRPACGPGRLPYRPGPAARPTPSARFLPARLSSCTEADLSRYGTSPVPWPSLPRGLPPAWPSRAPGTCRAASPRTAARAPPAAPGPAVPGPAGLTGSFLVPGSLLGTPVPKRLPGAKMLPDLFRPAETWPGLAGHAGLELPAGRLFPGPRSGRRRRQPGAHGHLTAAYAQTANNKPTGSSWGCNVPLTSFRVRGRGCLRDARCAGCGGEGPVGPGRSCRSPGGRSRHGGIGGTA
jgi:hypothetical protein